MKLQQIFDTMLTRMRAQGAPSVSSDGEYECEYASKAGLRCVVGCMMPDSIAVKRKREIRGMTYSMLPKDIKDYLTEVVAGGDKDAANFYKGCQDAHDGELPGVRWLSYFESGMQQVACAFDLTYTPLTEGAP